MKHRIYILVLFLITACSTPEIITTYNTVNLLNSQSYINYKNPLVYYLPRNIIKVNVEVTNTTFIPGPYAAYAEKLLGIVDVETNEFNEFKISNIQIETLAYPDTNQIYIVENENFGKYINYLKLTPGGIIQSINAEQPEESSIEDLDQEFVKEYNEIRHSFTDLSIKAYTQEKTERTYELVKKDTSVVRVPVTRKRTVEKSIEEKADEAAALIRKLRKRRFKVMAGMYETHPDGLAVKNMVEELDELEEEYLSLFIGKSYSHTVDYNLYFNPQPENEINRQILFKFSKTTGIISDFDKARLDIQKTDLSSTPVIINVVPVTASIALHEFVKDQKNKYKEKEGFHYRQPAMVEIEIISDMKRIYSKETLIAQYGEVLSLPLELFRNENLEIIYHSKYGSLKKIDQKRD